MGLQFKHITSTATFSTTKFSASSGDNTYFTGADPNTQVAGTPDILYKDLLFCKCNGKIYTHGKFYETGDSNGDSFTEYLQSQATKANKHLILSGAEVVESNVAGYYRRTDAFVYIKDLGIVSVVPLGSDYQNLNPTFQLWRCGRNTIPEKEWQYFWTNVQPSSSYPIVEKVCDWADLARLFDLENPKFLQLSSVAFSGNYYDLNNIPRFVTHSGYVTKNQNASFNFDARALPYYCTAFFLISNQGAGNCAGLLRCCHSDSWNCLFIKLYGTDDFGAINIQVSGTDATVSIPIAINGNSKICVESLGGIRIYGLNVS